MQIPVPSIFFATDPQASERKVHSAVLEYKPI